MDIFKVTFLNILNKFTPLKKKYLSADHSYCVNKELGNHARSRLRNEYLKDKNRAATISYEKQRNMCVSILREPKKCGYENLDANNKTENKDFVIPRNPFSQTK